MAGCPPTPPSCLALPTQHHVPEPDDSPGSACVTVAARRKWKREYITRYLAPPDSHVDKHMARVGGPYRHSPASSSQCPLGQNSPVAPSFPAFAFHDPHAPDAGSADSLALMPTAFFMLSATLLVQVPSLGFSAVAMVALRNDIPFEPYFCVSKLFNDRREARDSGHTRVFEPPVCVRRLPASFQRPMGQLPHGGNVARHDPIAQAETV